MRRVGSNRFIDPVQRTAAACAAINKDRTCSVQLEFLSHYLDFVHRRGTKTLANRHADSLDAPGGHTLGSQRLQCLGGWHKVAVHEGRRPTFPEWGEWICEECITGN